MEKNYHKFLLICTIFSFLYESILTHNFIPKKKTRIGTNDDCLQFENYLWNDLIFIVETKGGRDIFLSSKQRVRGTIDRKKVVSGPR